MKFAAGIPGFSHSTKVEESAAILGMTPALSNLHCELSRHITALLIRALKPGLLRDSKLLPELVRERRVKICMEALYYLPHAIEGILKQVAANCHDLKIVSGFSPILESVESLLMAERLSATPSSRVPPAVKIVAQCMATVTASQLPHDKETLPVLMRHLRINDPNVLDRYRDPVDSLLENLNLFLKNTAQGVIDDPDKQHHIKIVFLTIRLTKRLKFKHAAQELRDEFEKLRTWIRQRATGPSGKARDIAEKLLSELSGLTTDPRSPSVPPASGNSARAHARPTVAPGTVATPTSAHFFQRSQSPSGRWLPQPVSQVPNDAYISIFFISDGTTRYLSFGAHVHFTLGLNSTTSRAMWSL